MKKNTLRNLFTSVLAASFVTASLAGCGQAANTAAAEAADTKEEAQAEAPADGDADYRANAIRYVVTVNGNEDVLKNYVLKDEAGNELSGDHILYLVASYLKNKGLLKNDTVVATIMSNIGLDKALKELNIDLIKTDVGDKNVYQALKQNNLVLGGEQSGHIIFLDDATTGDGILTSIKILNILAEEKKNISSLLENLTIYPQVLKNVPVKDKNKILENYINRL